MLSKSFALSTIFVKVVLKNLMTFYKSVAVLTESR